MRVLYVEDNEPFSQTLIETINDKTNLVHFETSINYASAKKKLTENFYDFCILDLAIPLENGEEADIAHGALLLSEILSEYPGLVIMILTGQPFEDLVEEFLQGTKQQNLWGVQGRNLICYSKDKSEKYVAEILKHANLHNDAASIDLTLFSNNPLPAGIDDQDKILIKSFALYRRGCLCRLVPITEGLSGSKVYKLRVFDSRNNLVDSALIKIDDSSSIQNEINNQRDYIEPLGFHYFPNKYDVLLAGGYDREAVCYRCADDYDSNFFKSINHQNIDDAINNLQNAFDAWINAKNTEEISIREIRQKFCDDESFESILAQNETLNRERIETAEDKIVRVNMTTQHGDLHGANVLMNNDAGIVVIDYGDVRRSPVTTDPITLFISLWFHTKGCQELKEHENAEQILRSWFNPEQFNNLIGNAQWANSLRNWVEQVTFSHLETAAVVYAYSLRQFKYPDTNKDHALFLLETALDVLLAD